MAHADPTVGIAIVSAVGAAVVAIIGGFFSWLAGRTRSKEPTVEKEGSGPDAGKVVPLAELVADQYVELAEKNRELAAKDRELAEKNEELAAEKARADACEAREMRTEP